MTGIVAAALGGTIGAALALLIVSMSGVRVSSPRVRWALLGVALVLPALVLLGYLRGKPTPATPPAMSLAPPPSLDRMTAAPPAGTGSSSAKAPSVASLVTGLEAKLRDNPGDGSGWLLLARSYDHIGRIDQARDAYRQAVVLGAEDAGLAQRLSGNTATGAGAIRDPVAANGN